MPAADLNGLGVTASEIDARIRDRTGILGEFRRGKLQMPTNYGVLTEEFDDPSVQCVLLGSMLPDICKLAALEASQKPLTATDTGLTREGSAQIERETRQA